MTTSSQPRILGAARRPGSIELIRQGLGEMWSRRRLARYLVRAELHKHGADTFLGNVWWILDPLLQMAVYVVLVSVIFRVRQGRLPAVRLLGDPALEVVHVGGQRRDHRGHLARPDHQAGEVPEDRPAGRRHARRDRELRVRDDPAARPDDLLLLRPAELDPAPDPPHRHGPVRVQPGVRDHRLRGQRLLPRHRQRRPPRPAAVVLPVAGPVHPRGRPDEVARPRHDHVAQSVDARSSSPTGR